MAETDSESSPEALYEEAMAGYGASLERLARAYEADPEKRRDLLQEIHLALWRSLARFARRCSLRTWVFQVAHNTAASHVIRQRRVYGRLVGLEELEALPAPPEHLDRRAALEQLLSLVQGLKPLDRQIMVLYLEGLDAASIGEVTGISPAHVATKIHRIKNLLARRFHEGGNHAR